MDVRYRVGWMALSALLFAAPVVADDDCELTDIERLGKFIFFDEALSINANQSCAACHAPEGGWTGPDSALNATGAVYEGSIPGRFGNRKPPASAYAGDSPPLYLDGDTWVGGMFWDGRATGWTLGDPLAEQAQGPFLNPLEQALPDPAAVVDRICYGDYGDLFRDVWGDDACEDPVYAYEAVARAIAAYERSLEVNPFSSKYDAVLAGLAEFTEFEDEGRRLFRGKGRCRACHVMDGDQPVFTDFTYDNLGSPANPLNPFYYQQTFNPEGNQWKDAGLGGFLQASGEPPEVYEAEWGKVKVPTMRNLDLRPEGLFEGRLVKAFGHNGYFKSLKSIVHFYNTRDVLPQCEAGSPGEGVICWPPPEVAVNVNTDELGDLGLTDAEEDAIVAFLATLNDGWFARCDNDDDDFEDGDDDDDDEPGFGHQALSRERLTAVPDSRRIHVQR